MDAFEAIKATFFQECDELLADLESKLLVLESGQTDSETINAVFRAVHSVKGGAGAFGLEDLVRFAHVFETLLDELRAGRKPCDAVTVKTLLRASDVLADHVQAAQGLKPPVDPQKNKIIIDAAGTVSWNGQPVDEVTLRQYLDTAAAINPEPELHFQPDPTAKYEKVDETLAVIKRSNVTKLGFIGNEQYRGDF